MNTRWASVGRDRTANQPKETSREPEKQSLKPTSASKGSRLQEGNKWKDRVDDRGELTGVYGSTHNECPLPSESPVERLGPDVVDTVRHRDRGCGRTWTPGRPTRQRRSGKGSDVPLLPPLCRGDVRHSGPLLYVLTDSARRKSSP